MSESRAENREVECVLEQCRESVSEQSSAEQRECVRAVQSSAERVCVRAVLS